MSDLINRDSLLKKRVHIDGLFSDVVSAWDIAYEPTIDAVPVRRGKWIDWKYENMKCSLCGSLWLHDEESYKFCPNCGADMREVDNV